MVTTIIFYCFLGVDLLRKYFFTSESVTPAHPDKMCDQISDAILDAMLKDDPNSRVAVETATKTGLILVFGEVTTKTYVDIQKIVRNTVRDIGYDNPDYGFDADACSVLISLSEQSRDIALGVDEKNGHEQGAGDQGMMFGFATNETPEFMPLPIVLAHKLTKKLVEVRESKELDWVRPDGKSQVTIEYEDGKPKRADTILISTQHDDIPYEKIKEGVIEKVIKPVCKEWIDENCEVNENAKGWVKRLPGPYTLILKTKKECVAENVAPNLDTLGVRIPDHWFGDFVKEANIPIVTTSVNKSRSDFMTSLKDLDEEIKSKVDFIVYEGPKQGKPSKIIDLSDKEEVVER